MNRRKDRKEEAKHLLFSTSKIGLFSFRERFTLYSRTIEITTETVACSFHFLLLPFFILIEIVKSESWIQWKPKKT